MDENCGLCSAANDKYRLVAENDSAFSVVIFNPVNATHQNIIPKGHVTMIDQFTPAEAKGVLDLQYQVQQRLMELYPEHPPIIGIQTGKLATQEHIHWQAYSSDAHLRLLYARAHEPYDNAICSKAIGWKDERTHPAVPKREISSPEQKDGLESFLAEAASFLRGSGDIERDRQRLRELSHELMDYNKKSS